MLGISRRQFRKARDVLRLQIGFELVGRQRGREKEFRFLGAPLLAAFAEWAELHNGKGSESASADEQERFCNPNNPEKRAVLGSAAAAATPGANSVDNDHGAPKFSGMHDGASKVENPVGRLDQMHHPGEPAEVQSE